MKRIVILAISLACASSFTSFAKDSTKVNPFTRTLSSVPAAELPAKAAELVKRVKGHARTAATENVVKAALGMNPAAAPAIVAAISRAVPQMASVAAGTAAEEQPQLAVAIAKAAAVAAPSMVEKIVVAVCRAVPNQSRNIAKVVSDAVPGSSKEVQKAVASVAPQLPPTGMSFDQTPLAGASGLSPSFVAPRGPTVQPPYLPLSGTPQYVNPANGGRVPEGGRNYVSP